MPYSNSITETPNPSMLDYALEYAERGWKVFPIYGIAEDGRCQCPKGEACDNPGKHPISPRGFLDATADIKTITNWWGSFPNANIGIATGEKSGIFVLDVDGPDGEASLTGKALPATLTAASGRVDGGRHLYFQAPGYRVKNAIKALPGLDIRADGGYVVAPGSLHKSGNRYHWTSEAHTAEAPEWLLATLEEATDSGEANDEEFEDLIEGGRNVKLTAIAGGFRRQGLDTDDIYAAITKINAKRCKPPLPDDEVRKIAESIGGTHAATPNAPIFATLLVDPEFGEIHSHPSCLDAPFTDLGHAEVFAALFGGIFRYNHTRGKWLMWKEAVGAWLEDSNGAAKRAMALTLRKRHMAAATISNDRERHEKQAAIRRAENGRAMASALEKASTFRGIAVEAGDFDTDIWTLNAQGTLLNLSREAMATGDFTRRTTPGDLISKSAGTAYDPNATAPKWKEFLEDVFGKEDPELIAYIQRVCGYMLTGDISEQALWVAFGDGANGKSTFLSVLQALLGDYAASTPFNTFDADSRNQYGNDIAALQGSRFVSAIETDAEKRLSEARVKSITGGDKQACRFLYSEYFTYLPQYKIWLAVNHKPIVRGMDRGIWRRLKFIRFGATFDTEGIRDKHMATKLLAELPGIFNWALDGLRDYHENGMRHHRSVMDDTEAHRKESNAIEQWLDERVDVKAGAETNSTEAYLDYKLWATERGDDKPFGNRGFSQGLEGKTLPLDSEDATSDVVKITKERKSFGPDKGKMFFHGIVLRPLTVGRRE